MNPRHSNTRKPSATMIRISTRRTVRHSSTGRVIPDGSGVL